jgi:hypothetical protein
MRKALCAYAFALLVVALPASSRAHFVLDAPACWMSQDSLGEPEQLGPCGDEGGGTPTGIVTAFQTGQMISVTLHETVFHPGHYRIALAVNDRSELPAEPQVTPGNTACGTVPIQNPPLFPVLADGVFAHSSPFSGPQSIQIRLPDNVTCSKCTLQILEFMSEHSAPCFYHHCADISVQSVSGMGGGAGTGTGGAGASAGASGGAGASAGASGSAGASAGASGSAGASAGASGSAGASAGTSGSTGGSAPMAGSSGGCALTRANSAAPPPTLVGLIVLVVMLRARRRPK